MNFIYIIVLFFLMQQEIESIKILGIFPIASKSHCILGRGLMKGLAEKGHDVTMISALEEENPPGNITYRDIIVNFNSGSATNSALNLFDLQQINLITYASFLNDYGNAVTEATLAHPKVQQLLNSNETFDVIILEQFLNDGLKAFAYHYQVPLILFSAFGSNAWVNNLVANPSPPSYVPEQKIRFNRKNLFDRLKNFVIYVFNELNRNLIFFPAQNKIMKKYFPNAPDLEFLNYNASLVLLNSHLSTNKALPRVPSMIDIGGFHLETPKKLSKDLQEYLDSAKDGVIYFSMGSALQSSNFPLEKREAFLKVFSKMKQKVLWKWESDVLPGQPSNVKLEKWFPQQDILAHPNIKVFVTQGGLLSLTESIDHEVPVLVIPVFGDQVWNAAAAVSNGCGRCILYEELNEQTLEEGLTDVLTNATYRDNMKKQSRIMKDRQNKPIDDANYWIQYVVRHQGATHLRVDGLKLTWYQYMSLDVALFLLGVTLMLIYVLYFSLNIIFKKAMGQRIKVKKN